MASTCEDNAVALVHLKKADAYGRAVNALADQPVTAPGRANPSF